MLLSNGPVAMTLIFMVLLMMSWVIALVVSASSLFLLYFKMLVLAGAAVLCSCLA